MYVIQWCNGPTDAGEAQFRTLGEAERFLKQRDLDIEIYERRWSALGGFYLKLIKTPRQPSHMRAR